MSDTDNGVHGVFEGEEVREVLRDTFYQPDEPAPRRARSRRNGRPAPKPTHYEVICISLYKEDLARLDEMVKILKDQGHRKMSRSALIRYALDTCDTDALPRGY
jgi:hypothetical protein